MTTGTKTALALGFVGAFGLGVWTSPYLMHRAGTSGASAANIVEGPGAPPLETTAPASARQSAARAAATPTATVAVKAPELQERLRPVLNRGANMEIAAEGFQNAEQFATVAHAAHNTEVPFLLLKHRVLNEGKSVAEAIRESKPAVNAAVEANLARAQARSDIATVAS